MQPFKSKTLYFVLGTIAVIIIAGVLVKPSAAQAIGEGEACIPAFDECDSGLSCVSQGGFSACLKTCSSDSDCPSGEVCSNPEGTSEKFCAPPTGATEVEDERGGPFGIGCGGTTNPCTFKHFLALINEIIEFFMFILGPAIVTLMVAYGGFNILISSAKGSPDAKKTGMLIIRRALIGYAIMLAAWLIVSTFFVLIGVADWTGLQDWFEIKI